MKKREDFFNEEPPAGHDDRVRNAVARQLAANRDLAARSRRRWLADWRLWAAGVVTSAAAAVLVLRRPGGPREESPEWLEFQALIGSEGAGAELDLVSEEELDLEILENLDLLEEMEDV